MPRLVGPYLCLAITWQLTEVRSRADSAEKELQALRSKLAAVQSIGEEERQVRRVPDQTSFFSFPPEIPSSSAATSKKLRRSAA